MVDLAAVDSNAARLQFASAIMPVNGNDVEYRQVLTLTHVVKADDAGRIRLRRLQAERGMHATRQ